MQNDNDRKDLIEEFLQRRDFASRYAIYKNIDTDAAFERFKKRVGASERRKYGDVWKWAMGAAAAVAAIAVIGFASLSIDSHSIEQDQFITSITPGYGHAVLTTADGERMELTGDGAVMDTISIVNGTLAKAKETPIIVEVPRGGEYRITLSDGTKVHLNSESSIEFPSAFGSESRNVTLKGEAYFEVAHMEECPFVVDAHGVKVKQYGTSFNVQAYTHNRVEVTLLKGSIGVIVPFRGESQLTPGRQAVVCGSDISIHDVDVETVMGWTEGVFRFDNKELSEIADILSRWYNVNIVVEDSIRNAHFTGSIERNGKICDILDAIAEITGMKYSNDNSTIRLHK